MPGISSRWVLLLLLMVFLFISRIVMHVSFGNYCPCIPKNWVKYAIFLFAVLHPGQHDTLEFSGRNHIQIEHVYDYLIQHSKTCSPPKACPSLGP